MLYKRHIQTLPAGSQSKRQTTMKKDIKGEETGVKSPWKHSMFSNDACKGGQVLSRQYFFFGWWWKLVKEQNSWVTRLANRNTLKAPMLVTLRINTVLVNYVDV